MTTNDTVTDVANVQKAMNPIVKLRHAAEVNEFERLAAKVEYAERNGGLDDIPDWQELVNCIRYGGKLAHQATADAEQMRNALSATQFQLDILMRGGTATPAAGSSWSTASAMATGPPGIPTTPTTSCATLWARPMTS